MKTNLRVLLLLGTTVALMSGCFEPESSHPAKENAPGASFLDVFSAAELPPSEVNLGNSFSGNNIAGQYLASQFAQNRHDWKTAALFLNRILDSTPGQSGLLKKSMILAAGSGDIDTAINLASKLENNEDTGALAPLFILTSILKSGDYPKAKAYLKTMPQAGLSEFIYPLLESWTEAATGVYDVAFLQTNTIHLKHAILISDFMRKHEAIEDLLVKSMSAPDISLEEIETIADGFSLIGNSYQAIKLYSEILKQTPQNEKIVKKLEALEQDPKTKNFVSIKTPEQGLAKAIGDMARLLYQEGSDDSARIFSHLAHYIDPDDQDSIVLLGTIAARNEQYDQAIAYYTSLQPHHEAYLDARRLAAEIMEEQGQSSQALKMLEQLFRDHGDVKSLIAIGDIHRNNKAFDQAVLTYNQAEKALRSNKHQETLTNDFWHLHYVRGMALEQKGNWEAAEKDLKEALIIEPEHPFVLNYLGYAWADKGIHLEDSLSMIKKAVTLRPDDGYIVDSLGWVYYKMGRFEEAIPHLEKAVELLPYDSTINDHLGDSYWRVGRKLEARFQWERAKNNSEDEEVIRSIEEKLAGGLPAFEPLRQAHAQETTDPAVPADKNSEPSVIDQ